jgi:putative membrane protein insertion efficiency factor
MTAVARHLGHSLSHPGEPLRAIAALFLKGALKGVVWSWRLVGAPIAGPICRYEPSCSTYALQAIDRFGPVFGAWLTLKRLGRCHPWGGSGYDPVPHSEHDCAHHSHSHR